MRTLLLSFLLTAALAAAAGAADVLRLSSADDARAGGTVELTLRLQDNAGTPLDAGSEPRREFRTLTVTVEPSVADVVKDVTFERAGLTADVPVRFETRFNDGERRSWIVSFDEPVGDAQGTGLVARLQVELADDVAVGTAFDLRFDADTTALSNADGTVTETVKNGDLQLNGGRVTVAAAACTAGPTLCLLDDRFRLSVTWQDRRGNSGMGNAVLVTSDTGYFWFFGEKNVEIVVKALDGRKINGNYWIFFGSLTNVEFTLTVTDSVTGGVKQYTNPQGVFASRGDIEAFAGD